MALPNLPEILIEDVTGVQHQTEVHYVYAGETPPLSVQKKALLSVYVSSEQDSQIEEIVSFSDLVTIKSVNYSDDERQLIVKAEFPAQLSSAIAESTTTKDLSGLLQDFSFKNQYISQLLEAAAQEDLFRPFSPEETQKFVFKSAKKSSQLSESTSSQSNYSPDSYENLEGWNRSPDQLPLHQKRNRAYSTPPRQRQVRNLSNNINSISNSINQSIDHLIASPAVRRENSNDDLEFTSRVKTPPHIESHFSNQDWKVSNNWRVESTSGEWYKIIHPSDGSEGQKESTILPVIMRSNFLSATPSPENASPNLSPRCSQNHLVSPFKGEPPVCRRHSVNGIKSPVFT